MKPSPYSAPESANEAVKSAAGWQVRHDRGLTADEQAEFSAWLAASPVHTAAWRDVGKTAKLFEQTRASEQADVWIEGLRQRRQKRKWRVLLGSATGLAAAAAVIVLFLLQSRPAGTPANDEPSATPVIVRAEHRVLPDGSQVDLNAGAEIAVNYTAARREVRLLRGEAFFTVMKDAMHPFVVFSGEVEVRAVGTAFAVQLSSQAVDVIVTEGRVAVAQTEAASAPQSSADSLSDPVMVKAGNRLVVAAGPSTDAVSTPRALSADEINRRLAWSRPRLQLLGTALEEAVVLLNRENKTPVIIAEPRLGRLRLTGTFPADDARGFVHVLESNYEVRVEHRADGAMVLRGN